MSAAAPFLPTGLMPRFALFIDGVRRRMGEGIGRRHGELGPLSILLLNYLSATLRRLTALHARFAAGKLPAAPRTRRPAADRPRSERPSPAIPPGPVLLTMFRAGYDEQLQALLDDPEMRALLAAAPQAGRLLRPLWRKLSPRPLPELLRLPPRPRLPKPPRVAALPEPPFAASDLWEPTPRFPPWGEPLRPNPAPAARPAAPAAAPPPPRPPDSHPRDSHPPDWGRPAPPPAQRATCPPRWLPLLFQR